MNKTLKIALIFVLLAVATYALMELVNPTKSIDTDENILSENFDAAYNQIQYSWDTVSGFNSDMYTKHKNSIAYLEKNNYITAGNASSLSGCLRDCSAKKVCAAYKSEMKKLRSSRNDNQVIVNKNGMDTIAKNFNLTPATSSYYKEVCEIHKVYKDIKNFKCAVAPNFNPDNLPMWKSFEVLKSSKKRTADGFKTNQYYKDYMMEIADFASKLNIEAQLNNVAKNNFYSTLKQKLMEYFHNIYNSGKVTEDNKNLLGDAAKQYASEYMRDNDLTQLKNDYDDYLSQQNTIGNE